MRTTIEIWREVSARMRSSDRTEVIRLKEFLTGLDNPHARALTGPWLDEACDIDSAHALEAWIAGKIRFQNLTKPSAKMWLDLLYQAIKELQKDGRNMALTRLAYTPPIAPSPFCVTNPATSGRAELWNTNFQRWVNRSETCSDGDEWLAAIALSAIFNGALLDLTKINLFIHQLQQRKKPPVVGGRCVVPFSLPFLGRGNHLHQRWFIDPITEMLVWRFLKVELPTSKSRLLEKVIALLTAQGVESKELPLTLSDLMLHSIHWWSKRMAPADLQCASRKIVHHSIHDRSWSRIQKLQYNPKGKRRERTETLTDGESTDFCVDDILFLHPWLSEALDILNGTELITVSEEVTTLKQRYGDIDFVSVYLGWLESLLHGQSASRQSIRLSTIRSRFGSAAPRLLSLIGSESPLQFKTEELEDFYAELTIESSPADSIRDIANGLRDFHSYLHHQHGKPHIEREEDVFGDEYSLKPVDANLIDFDAYEAAQTWLSRQVGKRDALPICRLVLMLAFKAGLRRMEVFGLQLADIHVRNGLMILVRQNEVRRLKTDNSRRILNLKAFLSSSEREMLLAWYHKRIEETGFIPLSGQRSPFLFEQFSDANNKTWIKTITDRICSAVRAVTGDMFLFMHHLRHSFGTWTYLRLRAPEFPEVQEHFQGLPATEFALRTGRRLRTLLMWRDSRVSRTYAFAVCRLLGHSSPLMSFGHYLHSVDFVLGAIAVRQCSFVPPGRLVDASGFGKSSGYEYLQTSIRALAVACRHANAKVPESTLNVVPARRRGRPAGSISNKQLDWIPTYKVRDILRLSLSDKLSPDAVSEILDVPKSRVVNIVARIEPMYAELKLVPATQRFLQRVPIRVRDKYAAPFFDELNIKLAALHLRAPVLMRDGIHIHLQHLDPEKDDVVFRGEKDLGSMRKYIRFLSTLGLNAASFRFVLRSLEPDGNLPHWISKLDSEWVPHHLKRIRPKTAKGAGSYSQWVGLLPVDIDGKSLSNCMVKSAFYSFLAITSRDVG